MPTYLHTDSTSLAHRNFLRNGFGAHGKSPYWDLVPPDQIGKEALAYSKFLGQNSYTISSGTILNVHVGCMLCTIKLFGK